MADLARVTTRTLGPFSYAQLTALASRKGVDAAISRGELIRLLPNRYCHTLHSQSWLVRALAAVDWSRGVLAGQAALAMAGAGGEPDVIDVAVKPGLHRVGSDWVRVRSTVNAAPTFDAMGRVVVTPPAAVVQAFAWAPPRERAGLVLEACRRGVSPDDVLAAAQSYSRLPGRAELLRAVRAAGDGVESFLELRGSSVLRGSILSACVRQHRLCVAGRTYRVDAFHAASAVAIEFDGEAFHGSSDQRRRDRERDVLLASAGVQTLRFGYAEVRDDSRRCRERAEATVRARLGSVNEVADA